MPTSLLAQQPAAFTWTDWFIIACYLLLTTVIGARLAGKQATIRDFFLAGRKLPWWAISGSIIATEISAVTFVAVPTISFVPGGNLTYLQWAVGAIAARIIIGLYFVPRYFEQEIYSPYDYLEQRLGGGVKRVTTGLFLIGAVLGQGARVYITAFVLSFITGLDLVPSIWIIGAFSVVWTLLGGMTTVIWTDVIQFIVFTVGACAALGWAVSAVPGGFDEIARQAQIAGKFEWLDPSPDLSMPYTIWVGLLAMPFLNLAAFGTDQVMAQRLFCCRRQRDAATAIIVSSVGICLAAIMLGVGIALSSYFAARPFSAAESQLYQSDKTYLLPIFIVRAMPVGIRAVVVAAIFAAAISSLDSALAALAQTTLGAFRRLSVDDKPAHRGGLRGLFATDIGLSKVLVVAWAAALCLMATACIRIARQYGNAVELAFALVGYTYGPMLGTFLLAFLCRRRDHVGLYWSVPLSVLAVFGMYQHGRWADYVVWGAGGVCLLLAQIKLRPRLPAMAAVLAGVLIVFLLHEWELGTTADGKPMYLAFNWSYPIGTAMTLALGYAAGRTRKSTASGST